MTDVKQVSLFGSFCPFVFPLFVVLTGAASTGCFSAVDDAKTAAEDAALEAADDSLPEYSGAWTGTWADIDGQVHAARASFVQKGLNVTGTLALDDNPCFPVATLTAGVDFDGLSAELDAGDMHLHATFSKDDGGHVDGLLSAAAPALCLAHGACEARLSLTRE
jgi:hypothetical protein